MISIIVPIYKVENYIRQCVESIISQSYKDIEIILVDDGSPDNCPSICDEYALKDSRIIVIHQSNKGLIEARKSGLRAASGDYVCFVDGDDWIETDMYKEVANAIETYQPDCVITQFFYSYTDKEEKSRYKLNKELYTRSDLENNVYPIMLFDGKYYSFGVFPNCWTKVFRREILEKHLYDVDSRIRMGEDIAFTYPCLMECQSVAFVDKPLYHYRINPNSMTKAYDPSLKDIIMLPYYSLKRSSDELKVDLSAQLPYYLLYLVNFLFRNEANKSNKLNKQEKDKVLLSIINDESIINELSKIDTSVLPKHTKLLYKAIMKRSLFAVKQYVNILRKVI